ncbi:glutathione S-transferase [Dichotomopilus funicola]|uniref:glutathione transferase n=1 Tax=Dichotomopilus funicola TaxID=1934379 RepID=A0AAN6ZPE4_9PEZI|nr:glutathione S-transferase [Dichotomopilus funicola]
MASNSSSNPPKPIRVWLTPPGPNPWKVIFLLEELHLNYEIKSFRFDDVKKKPYTDINPNGRVPAIEDPNTGLTLWESGAIYQYLIELYDTEKRLTFDDVTNRHLANQYLHFQMSGQGPYYGQAGWFRHLHTEPIPSAIERYANEVRRVLGVLEGILAAAQPDADDGDVRWLVGGKMTFADMAFVPWNFRLSEVLVQPWDEVWEGLPHVRVWHERMVALPSWERSMRIRARLMDEQGLQWNGVPKGIETFTEYEKKIAEEGAGKKE